MPPPLPAPAPEPPHHSHHFSRPQISTLIKPLSCVGVANARMQAQGSCSAALHVARMYQLRVSSWLLEEMLLHQEAKVKDKCYFKD